MELSGDLSFRFPLQRGLEVRAVQQALARARLLQAPADGIFGPATRNAVLNFQQMHQLRPDGIVGRDTWSLLFSDQAAVVPANAQQRGPAASVMGGSWARQLQPYVGRLAQPHGSPVGSSGLRWCLGADGVRVDDVLPRSKGKPTTVSNTWSAYRSVFEKCAAAYGVPVELLVAVACTESGGNPQVVRLEPGYDSDEATPARISAGLMQTLISTARAATGDKSLDRAALLTPEASVRAGACYIKQQAVTARAPTNFDPPLVGIAYNAGSLRPSGNNRWALVQTERDVKLKIFHADAFVEYFNDLFSVLASAPPLANTPSFWTALHQS
ncbi:peptidoglycan-binding protein [Rhodocyclus tenuis]|uniref:peptidoglycan-binding protein n=1 Tax=Rhodocyclus tenuis TaxID=1066 RepID=UPI001905FBC6|nr:peptidoglycan-binding protein [Rhodocyclus tenuis]